MSAGAPPAPSMATGHVTSKVVAIAIGAVLAIELFVGGAIASNFGPYLALVVVALAGALFVLRYPSAIAYIALLWVLFEKSAGAHDPNLTSTLSTAGDGLLVLGVLLGIIVNIMRRHRPVLQFGPVLLGAVAFVAFGVASTISNDVPLSVAGLGILDSIRSLLMFLIVINMGISARDIHRFLYFMVGLMAVSAFVGVLQISPHSPAWVLGGLRFPATHGLMRVDGIFDHPLSLGDYLALTAPLAILLLALGDVKGRARTWLAAGVGFMVLAIVFTFAREAWLAVPVSILVVGVFVEPRISNRPCR